MSGCDDRTQGETVRPTIQTGEIPQHEKADDVDAWSVARTGRSFRFLRGRCPGPDQEKEGQEEDLHRYPRSQDQLSGSVRYSKPRSLSHLARVARHRCFCAPLTLPCKSMGVCAE